MRNTIAILVGFYLAGLTAGPVLAQNHLARGLWVGEAILSNVTEVVVGVNAANQVVAPNPNVTTPTADAANIRLLVHVDGTGRARLLKGVTVLPRSNTNSSDLVLVTDDRLIPSFGSSGKRLSSAAFDFGDVEAVRLLDLLADAVGNATTGVAATNAALTIQTNADANAAYLSFATGTILRQAVLAGAAAAAAGAVTAKGGGATDAQVLSAALSAVTNTPQFAIALSAAQSAQNSSLFAESRYVAAVLDVALSGANGAAAAAVTNASNAEAGLAGTNAVLAALAQATNAPSPVSSSYSQFVASPTFQTNLLRAAGAAATARASASGSASQISATARAAAMGLLIDSRVLLVAENIVLNDIPLNGNFASGGTLTGQIYLGANHPTNPFRHRRHPDHISGFPITRSVTLNIATNAPDQVGFGVDQVKGVYREEIFGLHKKLGPQQDIGLRTDGAFTLNRVSFIDALNR